MAGAEKVAPGVWWDVADGVLTIDVHAWLTYCGVIGAPPGVQWKEIAVCIKTMAVVASPEKVKQVVLQGGEW